MLSVILSLGRTLRYAAGHIFRRRNWISLTLSSPVLYVSPPPPSPPQYVVSERIIRIYGLSVIDINILSKAKNLNGLVRENELTMVENFMVENSQKIWRMSNMGFLSNELKDLAWQIAHQCLPTRDFQHRRSLVNNVRCPRLGCPWWNTHIFWNCVHVQQVPSDGTMKGFYPVLIQFHQGKRDEFYGPLLYIKSDMEDSDYPPHDFISVRDCAKLSLSDMYVFYLIRGDWD